MATTSELKARIDAFAKELRAEMGELSVPEEQCWLAAVEDLAAELGDAVATALLEQHSQDQASKVEANCPQCNKPGRYRGSRERAFITRRGPATIAEPEFYCPCCRKAFFPDDAGDRG